MPDAKDPFCCREIQPCGQCAQHEGHPLRGRFQPIQWRMETRTERAATRLLIAREKRLSIGKSEPGCFDKERVVLIDYHRYNLALLCDKEPVIDGLSYRFAFLTSS